MVDNLSTMQEHYTCSTSLYRVGGVLLPKHDTIQLATLVLVTMNEDRLCFCSTYLQYLGFKLERRTLGAT